MHRLLTSTGYPDWVKMNDDRVAFMEVKAVGAMLRLALTLAFCNPSVIRNIDRDWDRYDDITEIVEEVQKAKSHVAETEIKPSVNALDTTTAVHKSISRPKSLHTNGNSQSSVPSSTTSSHKSQQKFSPSHSVSNTTQVQCYKCGRYGHTANHCRTRPYCSFHQSTGHYTKDCRAKNAQSGNYPPQRPLAPPPSNASSTYQRQQTSFSNPNRPNSQKRHSQRNRSNATHYAQQAPQPSASQQAYLDFREIQDSHFPP